MLNANPTNSNRSLTFPVPAVFCWGLHDSPSYYEPLSIRMPPLRGLERAEHGPMGWIVAAEIHNNYSARRVYPILRYGLMVQTSPLPVILD